jgi:hypothetical protein
MAGLDPAIHVFLSYMSGKKICGEAGRKGVN